MKYSKNKKLDAVLNTIEEDIKYHFGNDLTNVKRYVAEFPNESDYNIAQYGCLLCYFSDIYKMYSDCGYKSIAKYSTDRLWETYKRQVGFVAKALLKANA